MPYWTGSGRSRCRARRMFWGASEWSATVGPARTLTISPGIKWMMAKLISDTPNSTGTVKTMRSAVYLSIDTSIQVLRLRLLQPGLPKIDAQRRWQGAVALQLRRPHLPSQRGGTGRDDVSHVGDALLDRAIVADTLGRVVALASLGEQIVQHWIGCLAGIDRGTGVQPYRDIGVGIGPPNQTCHRDRRFRRLKIGDQIAPFLLQDLDPDAHTADRLR